MYCVDIYFILHFQILCCEAVAAVTRSFSSGAYKIVRLSIRLCVRVCMCVCVLCVEITDLAPKMAMNVLIYPDHISW